MTIHPAGSVLLDESSERALWLYEQNRREPEGSFRFDVYVRRWCGWGYATAGVRTC